MHGESRRRVPTSRDGEPSHTSRRLMKPKKARHVTLPRGVVVAIVLASLLFVTWIALGRPSRRVVKAWTGVDVSVPVHLQCASSRDPEIGIAAATLCTMDRSAYAQVGCGGSTTARIGSVVFTMFCAGPSQVPNIPATR